MIGYLAALGFEESLQNELSHITAQYGRLFLADGDVQHVHWAQNIWLNPKIIAFDSISDGAKKLRDLSGLWAYHPYQNFRRGELISARLPYFSPKPLVFPTLTSTKPPGSWTLLDANTILASQHCSSPYAHGEVHFAETKVPPSRAYLKLWELFTRIGKWPQANDRCLEIGASPGSWTWVLNQLGAHVTAIDRAPLAPEVAALPNICFLQRNAFSFLPSEEHFDWIFSDAICFPEKLLEWVQKWRLAKTDAHFVCTIKFRGSHEYVMVREFEKIPDSQIVHLYHNKHELTWFVHK
jgi:23S rRNA (cytidine2498-2'-O)-methyltransferase